MAQSYGCGILNGTHSQCDLPSHVFTQPFGNGYGFNLVPFEPIALEDDSSEDEEDLFAAYALGMLPLNPGRSMRPRYSVRRKVVKRNIIEGWNILKADHFDHEKVYPDAYFRRRYRISPRLFKRIADAVTAYDDFFKQKRNSAGKKGCHPYQKCLAAIKMLATGCSADSLDREFRMSAALIMESLTRFIRAVVHLFKDEYLRHPTAQEIQELLQEAEKRGFPGMIGSIECMHWVWDKCPVAWHGEHKGHFHKPTIILEAVASYNLRFWHCFFGLPGSLNDINVLNRSPVFDDLASGNAPQYNFNVNGHSYDMGYYLADGIYPDWATLVKGVAAPVTEKQQLFTMKQSAYRKDVERAFGVLQAKFAVVRGPAKMHHVRNLDYTMRCCVIIHNMAVEDEHGLPRPRIEDFENGRKLPLLPKNVPRIEELIANHKKIENKEVHYRLQNDLMEHVWSRFGHTRAAAAHAQEAEGIPSGG